jgi:hypothetical protein
MSTDEDKVLYTGLIQRLRDADEGLYQSYPNLLDPPGSKSAPVCAEHILREFPDAMNILVERSAGLGPVSAAVLKSGRRLIGPAKDGHEVYEYPVECLQSGDKFILKHAMACAKPYAGPVDLVVIGCYGFTVGNPYLFDISKEAMANRIDRMEDGLDSGFQLSDDTIRIAVAADCQQIGLGEWPECKRSEHLWVHAVVTPTRIIDMHTGETVSLEPIAEQGEPQQ